MKMMFLSETFTHTHTHITHTYIQVNSLFLFLIIICKTEIISTKVCNLQLALPLVVYWKMTYAKAEIKEALFTSLFLGEI